jgi:ADP-ribose pyrophosphatase YjhB (NUDIX family)
MTIESNLCIILNRERILLLRKAVGIGKGKWYPTGGKVRTGETPEDGVAR